MLDLLKSYKTYLSGLWKYRVSGLVAKEAGWQGPSIGVGSGA